MHGHPEANLFDGVFIDFHTLYMQAGKAITRLRANAISTKNSCAGVIMLDRGDVKAGLRLICNKICVISIILYQYNGFYLDFRGGSRIFVRGFKFTLYQIFCYFPDFSKKNSP